MPFDINTFKACGAMMSGRQDRFLLKLAMQPVCHQSPIGRQNVDEIGGGLIRDFMKIFLTSL